MRVAKNPEERRVEILNTAELLFASRGYANTTVNDILGEIGIAKGTFYYYYKSKEEVMDAIISRAVDAQVAEAKQVVNDEYLSVNEKLFGLLSMLRSDDDSRDEGDRPNNAEMKQKSLVTLVRNLAPVVVEVVEQGKREDMFACDYPLESVEMLLVAYKIMFDRTLFSFTAEELTNRARCFAGTMEAALKAHDGSLNFVAEMLSGYPAG